MRRMLVLCLLALSACGTIIGCPGPYTGGSADIDEGFTILLATTRGSRHIQNARLERDTLEKAGWRNVYIVTKADHSEVLWGKYRTLKSAQDDLRTAKEHRDAQGRMPFIGAIIRPMPGKNVGRPEWSLLKARGAYTVLMATYFNVPKRGLFGRKKAAADLCEIWRKKGYEAYYYHGPARSHVTIGVFGDSAVQTISVDRGIRTVIRDQRIVKIIQEFPQLNVNDGQEIRYIPISGPGTKPGARKRMVTKPYPIRIPTRENEHIDAHINPGQWKQVKTPRNRTGYR